MRNKDLEQELEKYYHVGFTVKNITNGYDSYLSCFEDYDGFHITTKIQNETRLVIVAEPQKYAANFLQNLNLSSKQKRLNCIALLNTNQFGDLTIYVDDSPISPNDFVNNDKMWKSFSIRYTSYSIDDESEIIRVNILLYGSILSLINYSIEGYEEGEKKEIIATKYERNPINRQICLSYKGCVCSICGFDFEKKYGPIGKDVIEVHHIKPVSELGENYIINPIEDLVPLCSNCHTIIHKRKSPPYTIEEVIEMIAHN